MGDIASPTTYAASGFALIASVTLNEWVALVSIVVAVGTLITNWYYKHESLMIQRQEFSDESERRDRRSYDREDTK